MRNGRKGKKSWNFLSVCENECRIEFAGGVFTKPICRDDWLIIPLVKSTGLLRESCNERSPVLRPSRFAIRVSHSLSSRLLYTQLRKIARNNGENVIWESDWLPSSRAKVVGIIGTKAQPAREIARISTFSFLRRAFNIKYWGSEYRANYEQMKSSTIQDLDSVTTGASGFAIFGQPYRGSKRVSKIQGLWGINSRASWSWVWGKSNPPI